MLCVLTIKDINVRPKGWSIYQGTELLKFSIIWLFTMIKATSPVAAVKVTYQRHSAKFVLEWLR